MIDVKKYRWLKLEPVDAWFFRDGRPSNRGEDQSDIESEFPPNATTVVGAVRAGFARANGWSGRGSWASESTELKQILGDGFEKLGALSFLGPFLLREHDGPTAELLWPLPQHVVGRFREGQFEPEALLQPSAEPVCCDIDTNGAMLPEVLRRAETDSTDDPRKPPSCPEGMFVTTDGLNRILRGGRPDAADCVPATELFTHESRVGIRRDPESRTTGRDALYSPRYVRLKRGVSLVEAVAGIPDHWKLPKLMPLGGESRMATLEAMEEAPAVPSVARAEANVAIALAPARFDRVWWGAGPDDAASKLSEKLEGRVIAVALDRPRRVGGWDFNSNAPRPLVPFAPAGTVWWIDRDATDSAGLIQFGSFTSYGYGLAVVANCGAQM